jgi:hypothetical protein
MHRPHWFVLPALVVLALPTCRPVARATLASTRPSSDAAVAALAAVDAARTQSPPASIAELAHWPEAPMQHAPWEPSVASPWSPTVAWLFDHGLPDPRGLRYVRARMTVGELWSGAGAVVEANGWLLPRADASTGDWFLGWNGALYEPHAVLGDADLDVDAAPFLTVRDGGDPTQQMVARIFRGSAGEAGALIPSDHSLLTVAFLMRLGRSVPRAGDAPEPALTTAVADAAWALFDRAVCAHMRGDDRVTLQAITRVIALRDALAREATPDAGDASPAGSPLDFAAPADDLARDAARRLTRGPREAAATAAIEDRVAQAQALIETLDEVNARQWGQPGGVALATDPRVAALIALGDAAVDPLLDALVRDTRLTRSVHFWRDFARNRQPLFVHEAAYAALANILQEDFFRTASTGDDLSSRGPTARVQLAQRMRAHWARVHALPENERFYAILADDNAGPERWSQAAENLTRTTRQPVARSRSGAVEALLRRRIDGLLAPRAPTYAALSAACALTDSLVQWTSTASGLDTLSARWLERRAAPDFDQERCVNLLFDARDRRGDPRALDAYLRWLPTILPSSDLIAGGEGGAVFLATAGRHADDPRVRRVTAEVLTSSVWFPENRIPSWLAEAMRSPVGALPAVRDHVLDALHDRTVTGTVAVHDGHYALETSQSRGVGTIADTARNGTWPWRLCDEMAATLLEFTDFQRLLVAPSERDAVIAWIHEEIVRGRWAATTR